MEVVLCNVVFSAGALEGVATVTNERTGVVEETSLRESFEVKALLLGGADLGACCEFANAKLSS